MTDRLQQLLDDLAVEAPAAPEPRQLWRHAQRTRRRRVVATAAAGLSLAAAAVLIGLPRWSGPSEPTAPANGTPSTGSPMPARVTQPYGTVPDLSRHPVNSVIAVVETRQMSRLFFVPRRSTRSGVAQYVYLAVAADHSYRKISVSPTGAMDGTAATLSPDGRFLAVPVFRSADGKQQIAVVDVTGALVDPQNADRPRAPGTGDTIPDISCDSLAAGWTRFGDFACIVEHGATATVDLSHEPIGTGMSTLELTWRRSQQDGISWEITPQTLGYLPSPDILASDRTPVVLASDKRHPGVIALVNPGGEIAHRIRYPQPGVAVQPAMWCGAEAVLVKAADHWSVLSLDGEVRSTMPTDPKRVPLACRADGSIAMAEPGGAYHQGIRLLHPSGSVAGDIRTPRHRNSIDDGPYLTGIAVDAINWSTGGRDTHVAGFNARDWVDEAILVLLVTMFIAIALTRRLRRSL